jgi:tetratricopeptide (TPR) repeat protein
MLYIAFGLIVVGFLGFVWNVVNLQGIRHRGRQRATPLGRRDADRKNMSLHDRRLVKQAEKLLRQGHIQAGAQILESLGLARDAINALEKTGHITEAANVLIRMQRPGRAGVVYARHNMWDKALQCFKMADMPVEAAKCAHELGDFKTAGEYFEMAGRGENAAESWVRAGDLTRASRLFLRYGNPLRAGQILAKIIETAGHAHGVEINNDELNALTTHVGQGHIAPGLIELLARRNRLAEAIKLLIAKGLVKEAGTAFASSPVDIAPQLIADVNYSDRASTEAMATMLASSSSPSYAGMIYERLNDFARAAECFERGGDNERAIYCWERGGNSERVNQLRKNPVSPKAKAAAKHQFSVSDVTEANADAGERTALLPSSDAPPSASAPKGVATGRQGLTLDDTSSAGFLAPRSAPIIPSPSAPASHDAHNPEDHDLFLSLETLESLTLAHRDALFTEGSTFPVAAGKVVVGADTRGPGLFIVLKGRARVYMNNGTEDTVAAGQFFGESWFVEDRPLPDRAIADADSRVFWIAKASLEGLMDRDGSLARRLYKDLTRRDR